MVRFRPIMLTSLTTFGGLTPLLLEKSVQARFMIPMAISLAYGIVFATFITLMLIPAEYLILEDIKRLFFRLTGALQSGTHEPKGSLELSGKGYYFMVILMREFFTGVNNFRRACLSETAPVDPEGVQNLAGTV